MRLGWCGARNLLMATNSSDHWGVELLHTQVFALNIEPEGSIALADYNFSNLQLYESNSSSKLRYFNFEISVFLKLTPETEQKVY